MKQSPFGSRTRLAWAVVGMVLALSCLFIGVSKNLFYRPLVPHPLAVKFVRPVAESPVIVKGKPILAAVPMAASVKQALTRKDLSFDAKFRTIALLGHNLNDPERQLLLGYLRQPQPEDGLGTMERDSLKSDIINVLRQQEPSVKELTTVLVALSQDKAESPAMREYALQHLSLYAEKVNNIDSSQGRQINDTLWQATNDKSAPSAGIALLALARSVDGHAPEAYTSSQVGARALQLASDPSVSIANRMTALSVAGRMGDHDALSVAYVLALDNKQMALQRVALATLAQLSRQGTVLPADKKAALRQALISSPLLTQNSFRDYLAKE